MNIDTAFIISLAWLFLYALGIVVAGYTIVGAIAFWKTQKGSAKTFSLLLQRGNALKMLAIVLVIVVATLLTLLGKIEGAAVVGILSSIGGYILGGLERVKAEEENDEKPREANS